MTATASQRCFRVHYWRQGTWSDRMTREEADRAAAAVAGAIVVHVGTAHG